MIFFLVVLTLVDCENFGQLARDYGFHLLNGDLLIYGYMVHLDAGGDLNGNLNDYGAGVVVVVVVVVQFQEDVSTGNQTR
jgi:hypothetical protein